MRPSDLRRALPRGTPVRRLAAVPRPVVVVLVCALFGQIALESAFDGGTSQGVGSVPPPPPAPVLSLAALGDPDLAAAAGVLWLQAFDNPPGESVPFARLDYGNLRGWLERLLALRPTADYPLLAAIRLYAEVPDPARQRIMIDFVREAFGEAPERRWPWQAHAVFVARHRMGDVDLALALADELAAGVRPYPDVPAFARQMDVFVRAGIGDAEGAAVLLGALLEAGRITDPSERRFLIERLDALERRAGRPSESTRDADPR